MRTVSIAMLAALLVSCGAAPTPERSRSAPVTPGPGAPAPGRQPVADPPEPAKGAAELPAGSANGLPKGLNPGAPAAYWIWQDPSDGWHLRTTTAGVPHQFMGRILGVSGEIVGRPMRTEHRDRVRFTKRGMVFDFQTQGSIDGLDFKASDNGCVRFNLKIDGGPAPKRIFVGSNSLEPPHAHFMVCP
ncbi:MAG: hypothetical protein HY898_31215 [Deltaproteobacteria bacterium]|nr:hypothetical protein [Deltaproteobacteria bacterium]